MADLARSLIRVIYPVTVCLCFSVYVHWSTRGGRGLCHQRRDGYYGYGSGGGLSWGALAAQQLDLGGDWKTDLAVVLWLMVAIVVSTFCILRLYSSGAIRLIRIWLQTSVFFSLFTLGGKTMLLWLEAHCITEVVQVDALSALFLLWNFSVGGCVAIFWKAPRVINQGYLIGLSVLTSNMLVVITGYRTWLILIALVVWDLYAVLSRSGPLRRLVEMSVERGEEIPGLVYDTNPNQSKVRRTPPAQDDTAGATPSEPLLPTTAKVGTPVTTVPSAPRSRSRYDAEALQTTETDLLMESATQTTSSSADRQPSLRPRLSPRTLPTRTSSSAPHSAAGCEHEDGDGIGPTDRPPASSLSHSSSSSSSPARHLKLGLGDFVFYSLLIIRSSEQGFLPALVTSSGVLAGEN